MAEFLPSYTFTRIDNSKANDKPALDYRPIYFTPEHLITSGWYDGADPTTIATADGTLITQWDDKSGNGRHLVKYIDDYRPNYGTRTQNGLNAVEFDGSTSLYVPTTGLLPFGQKTYMFTVAIVDGAFVEDWCSIASIRNEVTPYDTSRFRGVSLPTANLLEATHVVQKDVGGTLAFVNFKDGDNLASYDNVVDEDPLFNYAEANIQMSLFDRTQPIHSSSLRANGFDDFVPYLEASVSEHYPSTQLVVGSHGGTSQSNSNWLDGVICELIIAEDLSPLEILKTEGYLAWKWGLLELLNDSHPYKTIKPTIYN